LSAQQEAQKSERQKAIEAKQKELDAKYGQLRAAAADAGQRERSAAQEATSFSGFGRSTFNADQQVQIEAKTSRAIQQLE
jgi:hypothetical protein